MKTSFCLRLTFLSLVLLLSGCFCADREEETKPSDQETQLQGSWLLKRSEGGYVTNSPSSEPPARIVYKFQRHSFEVYVEDKIVRSGTFQVGKRSKSPNYGDVRFEITFKDQYETTELYLVDGNNLVLESGPISADGTVCYFERTDL